MAVFKYKAFNKNRKIMEGLVESFNESTAVSTLRDRGYSIIFIKEKKTLELGDVFSFLNRITGKDLVFFSRKFAVLISANVDLVKSLRIVSEQTDNPKFKKMIFEIAEEVNGGSRLSEAFDKRPEVFSEFYISVIKSGETSGKLNEVLDYLADEMEKDFDMMAKIKTAMIYPAVLFLIMIGVGVFLLIYVIPILTSIIIESGGEIPMSTRILIGISDFLVVYWWALVLGLFILVMFFRFYNHTALGRKNIDYLKLRIPIFGELLRTIYVVRFTRSLSTLITGGVAISKSLSISADVVGNQVFRELIMKTLREVEDGNSISGVFGESKEIPNMVPQMMSVGEETGKMDLILEKISNFYSRQVNNTLVNLISLMEPIIVVIMGIMILGVLIAIITPMYGMYQGV